MTIKNLINGEFDVPAPLKAENWDQFIDDTDGCLVNDPIERGVRRVYEIRASVE